MEMPLHAIWPFSSDRAGRRTSSHADPSDKQRRVDGPALNTYMITAANKPFLGFTVRPDSSAAFGTVNGRQQACLLQREHAGMPIKKSA